MTDQTLTGDKAIISQVLDKIELAVRRTEEKYASPTSYMLHILAEELRKINEDLRQ